MLSDQFPCHCPHSPPHSTLQSHGRAGNDSTKPRTHTPSPLAFPAYSPPIPDPPPHTHSWWGREREKKREDGLQTLSSNMISPLPPCPVHSAVTCTPLLGPQNGTMTCIQPLGGSTYKSTCQFTCDEGFYLSGPERLDCSPSGHWTGTPPTCEGRHRGLPYLVTSQISS